MIKEVIAQALSILAMGFYILSYQQKNQKAIILLQGVAGFIFSVSFLLLGAIMGAILNLISGIRAILFMYKKQLKMDHILWLIGFIVVYIASYALTLIFLIDDLTPIKAILELLPIIGMVAITLGFRAKSAKTIRLCGLVNEPAWLIYGIYSFSIGAIICNSFSLISIIIGMLRLDKKETNN